MGVRIFSPATSANVGAGFDCLGLCFSKENVYEFSEEGAGIEINGIRVGDDTRDLTVRSFFTALDGLDKPRPGSLRLSIRSAIPMSRGLGSSAACICAGVAAAFEFAGAPPDRAAMLDIAARIEGHPDNVAPNLHGGATLSYEAGGRYRCLCFAVSRKIGFVALIPRFRLATKKSRRVLPHSYSRKDAVFNITRTALTMHALSSGDGDLLRVAVDDRMHEPYRRALIPGYEEAAGLAREAGALAVYLSGAGPALVAIAPAQRLKDIKSAFARSGSRFRAERMTINASGLRTERFRRPE